MQQSRLIANHISKEFGFGPTKERVLHDISISFEQGSTYAVTGASGSGKTTLLHILAGLETPTIGSVHLDETNIAALSEAEKNQMRNLRFGFIFQFHYLINELTIEENIMMPGLIKGTPLDECLSRALELLSYLGLEHKRTAYPSELSGGQQQRIAIARSIFNKPQFLFADEPTGNLDASNAQQITDLLLECQKTWGMGLILCSHDAAVYERMETRWHLEKGMLVQDKV